MYAMGMYGGGYRNVMKVEKDGNKSSAYFLINKTLNDFTPCIFYINCIVIKCWKNSNIQSINNYIYNLSEG